MNKGYSKDEKIIKDENVSEEEYATIASLKLKGVDVKLSWRREYLYDDIFRSIIGTIGNIEQEKYDDAYMTFQDAIQVNKDYANSYYYVAKVFMKKEEYFDAVDWFTKAIEKDPKLTEAYNENPLSAMKILFYARDIRGGLGERNTFRILIKYIANNYPEALVDNMLEKVINLDSNISKEDLQKLIESKYQIIKYKIVVNESQIEKIFTKYIDKYLDKIERIKM